ncbi:EAL domain-containing protein [Tersicoccus sp. MR15.9]|uniref:putative bifunctional diguanylate cyclase/phosphodiesterase n=1 Tax=Tersicoccus mangrovi TaxID=3121635 RepID=UPI002FE5CF09
MASEGAKDDGNSNRLDELVEGIVRISAGDFAARLPISDARDEIDALTTGINLLAEELESMYSDLESRVAERTIELQRARMELQRLVDTDDLTGLASRRLLLERAGEALHTSGHGDAGTALVVLDLDDFRLINDSLGHSVGDAVLLHVASRLRSIVEPDQLVARLGGDEFAILVPDGGIDKALAVAHRALDVLGERVMIGPLNVGVDATAGVRAGEYGTPVEDLLRDADTAMNQAKGEGKGRVAIFTPVMHRAARERVQLISELRRALATDQLEAFYQPIVDLRTDSVAGAEALVRWRHPERGLLPPAAFLEAAEEGGLMVELGRWMLGSVIGQVGRWSRELTLPECFRVHVNISPSELRHGDLAEFAADLLQGEGITGRYLTLEITEALLVTRGDVVDRNMEALREIGIPLEIDDFGTGYSSISYLQSLPAENAKIDQSLTSGLLLEDRQRQFVSAILDLIHTAGMGAVAEGVEERGQADLLRSLNCEYAQGYYFSRPVPAETMRDYLSGARQLAAAADDTRWA